MQSVPKPKTDSSKKKALVGFIGQGWIGKAYADNYEARGYQIVRYSLEQPWIKNGDRIKECDIVFIAVWTPTTPSGFDASIVESVLPLVGNGGIAVLKSTILPGTTADIQRKFPDIVILYAPEFLSISSQMHDASHPFANLVGIPKDDAKHYLAAKRVMKTLPRAPFSMICKSAEAEIFKYAHNANGYFQIILFNLLHDLSQKFNANWDVVNRAIGADPFMTDAYSSPIHKGGRGAGGGCFIKDMAALGAHIKKHLPNDKLAHKVFQAIEAKNIDLLTASGKDLNLLTGVYGEKALGAVKQSAEKPRRRKKAPD